MRRTIALLVAILTALLTGALAYASPASAESGWRPAPTKTAASAARFVGEWLALTGVGGAASVPARCWRARVITAHPKILATDLSPRCANYTYVIGDQPAVLMSRQPAIGWVPFGRGPTTGSTACEFFLPEAPANSWVRATGLCR